MKVHVRVPATSANLGAGFDVFGLAVNLFNEFIVKEADKFEIKIQGDDDISTSEDNLFYKAFKFLFQKQEKSIPRVQIQMKLNIPQGRGFGSSATAVIGGLLSANTFLSNKYSKEELLQYAIHLECGRHPDNVSTALFGGMIVIASEEGRVIFVKLSFPKDLKAVYFVPDFALDTLTGRILMQKAYLKEDVVFSTSRVALFLAALQKKQYPLLRIAMQDRLHQPTRTKIFPLMPEIIQAAIDAGAYGAALSGGGSSIIALADKKFKDIASGMQKKAEKRKITGKTYILTINDSGSEVKLG
jgi:homoserine kinase